MIVAEDLNKDYKRKDKYGYSIVLTAEALQEILDMSLHSHGRGEISRIAVDQERMIVSIYYVTDKDDPWGARIGQAGEDPTETSRTKGEKGGMITSVPKDVYEGNIKCMRHPTSDFTLTIDDRYKCTCCLLEDDWDIETLTTSSEEEFGED